MIKASIFSIILVLTSGCLDQASAGGGSLSGADDESGGGVIGDGDGDGDSAEDSLRDSGDGDGDGDGDRHSTFGDGDGDGTSGHGDETGDGDGDGAGDDCEIVCASHQYCADVVINCFAPPCPQQQCEDRPACGGIAGFECAGAATCEEDPRGGCDPQNGGADCGGLCECNSTALCVEDQVFNDSPDVCACERSPK